MPYTFTYNLDMQVSDADNAALAEIAAAIKDKSTTYSCYFALCSWIISKADIYSFINSDLAYLKIDTANSKDNLSIIFGLTDDGTNYFTNEIAAQKQLVLATSFIFFDKNGLALSNTYGLKSLYKDNDCTKGVNDTLLAIKEAIKEPLSCEDLNGHLFEIIGSITFPSYGVVATKTIASLVLFLNEATFATFLKEKFIELLVDNLQKKVTKSSQAKADANNKARVSKFLTNLGINIDVSKDYSPTGKDFMEGLGLIKTTLKGHIVAKDFTAAMFANNVLYSDLSVVLGATINDYYDYLCKQTFYNQLESAGKNDYNPNETTRQLLYELKNALYQILDNLTVTIKWSAPPAADLLVLDKSPFYSLFDFDGYTKRGAGSKLTDVPDFDTQTVGTRINTFDIPLLDLSSTTFNFWNTKAFLYVNQPGVSILNSYASGVATKKLDLSVASAEDKEALVQIVKAMNQATSFTLQRTYYPFYLLKSDSITPQLIWPISSGSGNGLSRFDSSNTSLHLWTCSGDIKELVKDANTYLRKDNYIAADITFTFQELCAFIGLDYTRYIVYSDFTKLKKTDIIDATTTFRGSIFELPPAKATDDIEQYIQCNMPYATGVNKGVLTSAERLKNFSFIYLRKVKSFPDPAGGTMYKVVKTFDDVKNKKTKNRPNLSDAEYSADPEWYINPPISMQIKENYTAFNLKKKGMNVIKNKGSFLGVNKRVRDDAGKVMGGITGYSSLWNVAAKLSATEFGNVIVGLSPMAQTDWQNLKKSKATQLPTNQEWCHLKGHGDGGDERIGNFAGGSYHCNTEQLAVETGQRPTTQIKDKIFKLKSTAYLIADNTMKTNAGSYLQKDASYIQKAYKENYSILKGKDPDKEPDKKAISDEIAKTSVNSPVAAFIRYKILQQDSADVKKFNKVFDYVFEGQSEFIDENQYNIILQTMSYLLDPLQFWKNFNDFITAK